MSIREFRLEDYDGVVDLWRSAGIILSATDDRAGIACRLRRDAELFLVYVVEDLLVGAVMGAFDGRRGWINHLAVRPAWQGGAIGSALVEALEARLREKGCPKVNLLIELGNAGVQPFYEGLGFRRDDLIFMEKWLR